MALSLALLTGTGCTTSSQQGSWVPETQGPWDGSLFLATSEDGLEFTEGEEILTEAGVPNLLTNSEDDIVLIYQYFSSTDEAMFDQIAYSVSSDEGKTWSEPKAITFEGLPEPLDAAKKPMDPTLVKTENGDGFALYFTYHAKGAKNANLFVALSSSEDLTQPFVVQETPALSISGANLLDPAVVFLKDTWHHYSWQDKSENNYHSESEDGLTFTKQQDISLSMDFLGQAVVVNNGLRFYGTGKEGVMSAFSYDGNNWTMDIGSRAMGADPGVLLMPDGTYLMVYTKVNFNTTAK
jgi:hypothetical protein